VAKRSIEEIVNHLLLTKGGFSSADVVAAAGVSRQALHRHLARMVEAGKLTRAGQGRAARYLARREEFHVSRLRTKTIQEDRVWGEVRSAIPRLAKHEAASAIYAYAFTEMLNNAIDHSGSQTIDVHGAIDPVGGVVRFSVIDRGLGAFKNVRDRLGLESLFAAIEALSKGKVSTLPERHSGEGIFFTSKMARVFSLEANGLAWIVDNARDDQTIASTAAVPGTTVRFEVALDTSLTTKDIFERYSHDFQFDTSRVVVKLFERGGEFVSRSEAKRVVAGLERFREVVVDFHRVGSVGQGFADEIFRVWARTHPETKLVPERMVEPVAFMVERARRAVSVQ
jgi:anti-sigma regulatory factor (Ser/Thr protein kinase)